MRDNSVMAVTDEEREPYLRVALAAFESGSLDADEYMRKVQAISSASTVAEMARALAREGPSSGEARVSSVEVRREPPAYDAVDLALMMNQTSRAGRSQTSKRYAVVIMVILLFVVLLAIGIWLATQIHAGRSPQSGFGAQTFSQPSSHLALGVVAPVA